VSTIGQIFTNRLLIFAFIFQTLELQQNQPDFECLFSGNFLIIIIIICCFFSKNLELQQSHLDFESRVFIEN